MSRIPIGFMDVSTVSNVQLDIRYATANNFMSRRVVGYDAPLCWMHRDGVEKLHSLAKRLEIEGLGLLIWDAYRPRCSTLDMVQWAETTGQEWLLEQGYLVLDSRHNRGGAVDLSLYRLDNGDVLDMGTEWDFFGAESNTFNVTGVVLENRVRLRSWMEQVGFVSYDVEWWHFELPNATDLPALDVSYTLAVE